MVLNDKEKHMEIITFLMGLPWIKIAVITGIICGVFMAVKRYTDSTETTADNWLGNSLGWVAGLFKAIFSAIPGVKKFFPETKNDKND